MPSHKISWLFGQIQNFLTHIKISWLFQKSTFSWPVATLAYSQVNDHAHQFRSTSERSGAHMYHLFIDEIVEN